MFYKMVFLCGVTLYASYCIFIFKFVPTKCLTISTAEYIYPNTCNNITCNYMSAPIGEQTTIYEVTKNRHTIFSQNIVQRISSNLCILDNTHHCKDIGICCCDPNGLSTRICYNHTSGGEGQLTIRCSNSDSHQNKETLATIAAIPSNVHPNNMIYSVKEGRIFGPLICNASCGPPCTFRWVGPACIINSCELVLHNATRKDNGTYQCEATNTMGTSKVQIVLIINYGPKQVVLSTNKTYYPVNEDSDVPDITCTADCQPDCTLMWITPTGQVISNEILSLKTIQRSQAGTYQCNASNVVGNMVSADVTISVLYGAEIRNITIDGENFTIPENVEKRLICKIDGVPKPYGRLFYNDGKKLSSIHSIVYVMVPLCKDTGNYTCAAGNSEGKANQTKELFVLCSPRPVARLQSRIAVGNDSILNISVILVSYPQPNISWMFSKNGSNEIVRSNDTIGIYQHVSSIYITDIKTSQYGMYVLEATNGISNDFKHVFEVLPQRQPNIPTNFSASCDAPDYANLQWIPSFDGGDTQQFKLYYAVQERQIVFSKHRIDIKEDENKLLNFERVDGLLSATSYVFKLIAYNTLGESNFIKAYCNTTKLGSNNSSGNDIIKKIGASIGASFFILIVAGLTVLVLKVMKRKTYIKKENSQVYQSTQPGTSSSEYDKIGRIKDEHIYQDLKKYNKDSRQQLDTSPVYTNINI